MKFLITGGAGFLGTHLAQRLLSEDHHVVAMDNFYTGSKSNISRLLKNPNFSFIEHDVTVPFYVQADGIFNLACPASPLHYQKFPVDTLKTSVLGAINALELAKQTGVRIFQASTSEIYGDPKVSPQVETYWGNVNPFGIRSCYDEGKRAAETLFYDYHNFFGVEIRIARIFNTFGPLMLPNDGRVVSNFIIQSLLGEDITIYGSGQQSRSFCYVDDLIAGIIKLFFSEGTNYPVNLGNPSSVTMLELAREIISLTGTSSKITFRKLPGDDPAVREPDINLAKKLLSWHPTISRRDGLLATIEYFKSLPKEDLIPH
jgi:UDP-glucuronate decarboxylase